MRSSFGKKQEWFAIVMRKTGSCLQDQWAGKDYQQCCRKVYQKWSSHWPAMLQKVTGNRAVTDFSQAVTIPGVVTVLTKPLLLQHQQTEKQLLQGWHRAAVPMTAGSAAASAVLSTLLPAAAPVCAPSPAPAPPHHSEIMTTVVLETMLSRQTPLLAAVSVVPPVASQYENSESLNAMEKGILLWNFPLF